MTGAWRSELGACFTVDLIQLRRRLTGRELPKTLAGTAFFTALAIGFLWMTFASRQLAHSSLVEPGNRVMFADVSGAGSAGILPGLYLMTIGLRVWLGATRSGLRLHRDQEQFLLPVIGPRTLVAWLLARRLVWSLGLDALGIATSATSAWILGRPGPPVPVSWLIELPAAWLLLTSVGLAAQFAAGRRWRAVVYLAAVIIALLGAGGLVTNLVSAQTHQAAPGVVAGLPPGSWLLAIARGNIGAALAFTSLALCAGGLMTALAGDGYPELAAAEARSRGRQYVRHVTWPWALAPGWFALLRKDWLTFKRGGLMRPGLEAVRFIVSALVLGLFLLVTLYPEVRGRDADIAFGYLVVAVCALFGPVLRDAAFSDEAASPLWWSLPQPLWARVAARSLGRAFPGALAVAIALVGLLPLLELGEVVAIVAMFAGAILAVECWASALSTLLVGVLGGALIDRLLRVLVLAIVALPFVAFAAPIGLAPLWFLLLLWPLLGGAAGLLVADRLFLRWLEAAGRLGVVH